MKRIQFFPVGVFLPICMLGALLCGAGRDAARIMWDSILIGVFSFGPSHALLRSSGKLVRTGKLVFSAILGMLLILASVLILCVLRTRETIWYAVAGVLLMTQLVETLLVCSGHSISTGFSEMILSIVLCILLILEKDVDAALRVSRYTWQYSSAIPLDSIALHCLLASGGMLLVELAISVAHFRTSPPSASSAMLPELPVGLLRYIITAVFVQLTLRGSEFGIQNLLVARYSSIKWIGLLISISILALMRSPHPRDNGDRGFLPLWGIILFMIGLLDIFPPKTFSENWTTILSIIYGGAGFGFWLYSPKWIRGRIIGSALILAWGINIYYDRIPCLIPVVGLFALLMAIPELSHYRRMLRAKRLRSQAHKG